MVLAPLLNEISIFDRQANELQQHAHGQWIGVLPHQVSMTGSAELIDQLVGDGMHAWRDGRDVFEREGFADQNSACVDG